MGEVSKLNYLQRRGSVWYVRRKVPKDLVSRLGKREVLRSLRTSDHREAAIQARLVSAEIEADFEEARNRPVPKSRWRLSSQPLAPSASAELITSLPEAELHRLASEWLAQRELMLNGKDATIADGDAQAVLENVEDDLGWLQGGGDQLQLLSSMQASANDLLASQGIKLNASSHAFRTLVDLLTRAEIVRLRRVRARLQRDFAPQSIDPLFDGISGHGAASASPALGEMKLSDLFERFVTDLGRSLTERTVVSYRAKFRVMKEIMGDSPIARITREDCRRVQAAMSVYPARAHLRFGNLAASKVIEIAKREKLKPLHPKTATNYLVLLSSLFEFAVREDLMARNPAKGLAIVREVTGQPRRRPFSMEQLRRIFAPSHYFRGRGFSGAGSIARGQGLSDGQYWVPLISLFTGMRLNECCQLLVGDVSNENGVWVLHVRADIEGQKKLKTLNATRAIPVHPELEKLGFLDFARGRQSGSEARLFPDLKKGAKGYLSDPFQKKFRRFLTAIGVHEPGATFHSFRHTFRDGLRNGLVSEEATRYLGGWARGRGAEAGYGDGFGHDVLKREISKVNYRDLDLSHLYPGGRTLA